MSFGVYFPGGRYTVEEAADIIESWLPELKGTTPNRRPGCQCRLLA